MIAERPDSIECLVDTETTDEMRLRRRCGLYDLSVRSFEGLAGAPVSAFADLPLCCALVPAPDDQSKALGVNLWAVEASDDTEADRAWGECLADDAMRYDRENPGADILSGILYWMGAALHFEGRCAGPLENGFVRLSRSQGLSGCGRSDVRGRVPTTGEAELRYRTKKKAPHYRGAAGTVQGGR